MKEILNAIAHRPYPLPSGPWIMMQRWHDLLFAHWPVDPELVRARLPAALRPFLDTYQGKAWVGVIPFWMSNVRLRGVPPIPGVSTFAEMNCRTYLTVNRKPGVYFFSLDAESLLAVYGARMGYGLQYFFARMRAEGRGGPEIDYASRRVQRPKPAEFRGRYGPNSVVFNAQPGSVEHFVAERYCLYTVRGGQVWRGNIHHLPWPLQYAHAEMETNSVAASHGIQLPQRTPLLHFAREIDVLIWPPERA